MWTGPRNFIIDSPHVTNASLSLCVSDWFNKKQVSTVTFFLIWWFILAVWTNYNIIMCLNFSWCCKTCTQNSNHKHVIGSHINAILWRLGPLGFIAMYLPIGTLLYDSPLCCNNHMKGIQVLRWALPIIIKDYTVFANKKEHHDSNLTWVSKLMFAKEMPWLWHPKNKQKSQVIHIIITFVHSWITKNKESASRH